MLKGAILASTLVVAGSMAMATNNELVPGAPASDAPCHPVQSLDLACTMRVIDANGDGTISAAELSIFTTPPVPTLDWPAQHSPRSTGLDFKDAAVEPGPMLAATLERDSPQRLIPALFALGALVILLGRRPT